MIKRIVVLLLSLCLLCSLTAFAAGTLIKTEYSEYSVGHGITANVSVTAEAQFQAVSFEALYDPEKLVFVSGLSANLIEPGKLRCIAVTNGNSFSTELKFGAIGTGEATVEIVNVVYADVEEHAVSGDSVTVSLKASDKGDCDANGMLDTADLSVLKNFLAAGLSSPVNVTFADFNDDGVLDTSDLACLKLRLAGQFIF